MRPNRTISKDRWGASSTDSEDCSSLDDDPRIISIHLAAEPGTATSVQKAYQGMVDMLDDDLQVIYVSERNDILAPMQDDVKISNAASDIAVPCLATVLFFNGNEGSRRETPYCKTRAGNPSQFSKPDLLKNHMWNSSVDFYDFEKELKKDFNDNDIMRMKMNGRKTPSVEGKGHRRNLTSGRRSPFLKYDAILKESREREQDLSRGKTKGLHNDMFDLETAETTLDARKQLETWPWEYHHRANTTKGISQCQSNAQDFYAYQPNQDVTRLYGDVIDTTKISRRKLASVSSEKDDIIEQVDSTVDDLKKTSISNTPEKKTCPVSTTDFPLMAVREVHYGRKHLRYTLFVSDTMWTDQVEFYRLLLRRHEVTLRDNFCFFTVYSGENTDIQFALKKLSPKQHPVPLRSTTVQFKVHNVGHLVPLLPHACNPISDVRWQTRDHDENIIILEICPRRLESDTSSSHYDRDLTPLEDTITSPSELGGKHTSDDDEDYSLERLDSFVEPELPHRMPLLKPALYTGLGTALRFGRRNTGSPSPGSSSSNSPERRPRHLRSYTPRLFSDRSIEFSSTSTLPSPKKSSMDSRPSSRSVFSESSDDPENTNFYRRAKFRKDTRRKSEGATPPRAHSRDPHRSKSKSRHRAPKKEETAGADDIEFYV